jgi:hypothetical protein
MGNWNDTTDHVDVFQSHPSPSHPAVTFGPVTTIPPIDPAHFIQAGPSQIDYAPVIVPPVPPTQAQTAMPQTALPLQPWNPPHTASTSTAPLKVPSTPEERLAMVLGVDEEAPPFQPMAWNPKDWDNRDYSRRPSPERERPPRDVSFQGQPASIDDPVSMGLIDERSSRLLVKL